ncbi:MAG TPA: PHP domain-containing protein [Solirubrobacteraceae bacterium]|nr:PHP domain-containing protein [Solirubrobacteraceae bacterium]
MSPPTFDLQSHSTCSDGELAPAEVVARAREAGVELLALSDHDTVEGVGEALRAARELGGITVVPAVEISALDPEHEDLHILGYLIDHESPALLDALAAWRVDRNARAGRMAAALREAGLELELPDAGPRGRPIGRPHLAQAVLDHPANAERLRREGLDEPGAVLEAYLLPGRPGYRPRTTPSIDEAVAVIHAAGGIAVWAHPYWDLADDEDIEATLRRFAAGGMDGVEAFYVTHSCPQTLRLARVAGELGLCTTGSADFHGPSHARFHAFRAFDLCGLQPDLGPLLAVV